MDYDTLIPGDGENAVATVPEHSHDSFVVERHKHFLAHNAGPGAYVHGRVHQEVGRLIHVSDLIHKRGYLKTDDLLLMEEQMLAGCGDPLSTNSRLGRLVALAVLPSMSTANGEGDLIAYYEKGVVAFNTFIFPRETRANAQGEDTTQGWKYQRMVSHLLNTVSATGRHAVAVLPRDHFFRSRYGCHFLKSAAGDGTLTDEAVNIISDNVSPILDLDPKNLLWGAATGHWLDGHRMFVTTGLHYSNAHSASPLGRGFLSYNQRVAMTENRSPLPSWEGLWVLDHGMAGVIKFERLAASLTGDYGFIASSDDTHLYFAEIDPNLKSDTRDEVDIPVEWDFTTGQFLLSGVDKLSQISGARLSGVFESGCARLKVSIRTDREPEWSVWKDEPVCTKPAEGGEIIRNVLLGAPALTYKEFSWAQFRIEGRGHAEITEFSIDFSETVVKNAQGYCAARGLEIPDYFRYNNEPPSTRWE